MLVLNHYVQSLLLTTVAIYSSLQLALQMDETLISFLPRLVIFGTALVLAIHLLWPPTDYYTSDLQYSALFVLLQVFFMSAYTFSEPFMLIPVLLIAAAMFGVSVQHTKLKSAYDYKRYLLPIFLGFISLLFTWPDPKLDEFCATIVSYMLPQKGIIDSSLPTGGFLSTSPIMAYGYTPLILIVLLYTFFTIKLAFTLKVNL